jgi:hypothetical protein
MSQYPCTISDCPRLSRVLCYCCTKNYCIEHLKDHNEIYLSQLYQLTNEINLLSEYYRDQYRQQLDQWRHESHQARVLPRSSSQIYIDIQPASFK